MTNAVTEGEIKMAKRLHVRSLWKIRHETEEIMLEESLIWDGRFYGSEYRE